MSQRERCDRGEHMPLVNRAKYQAAGPFWKDFGDCPFCLGTVKVPREQEAAGQAAQGTGAPPSPGSTNEGSATRAANAT